MRAVPRLTLVTDRTRVQPRSLLEVVDSALAGGADAVQLREKDLAARDLLELARAIAAICRRHRAKLLINDRIDVAVAVGADGIHLPSDSFSPQDARSLLGAQALIGVSTHSATEAAARLSAGADYVYLGPIFETESKRRYGAPLGLADLAIASRAHPGRIIAIGGITACNASDIWSSGAHGIAVIGAGL